VLRSVSFFAACVLILGVTGCASSSSAQVSAGLGAASLPAINPPAYIPGPLNGESTPRGLALRRPLGVIVENYAPDSRPQTGLAQASTVIETLAEGGVTRFLAIYLERDAAKVGPVRSTRLYFDRWASAFHMILTHVGGNDDAQNLLWRLPSVYNIDEQKTEVNLYNTGTNLFWRSKDRAAPHNMYVNTYTIRRHAERNHQDWGYDRAYLLHKHPAPLSQRGHGGSLDVAFVDPLVRNPAGPYAVRYRYDRKTNAYLRIMGGTPHVDAATHQPLRPANVIVMRTGRAVADPFAGPTPESILIPVLGAGTAIYFRDGKVQRGWWHQKDGFAPLRFFDRRGREVAFNPGQTWIEVVPRNSGSSVSWSFR
jgi:hypothetical protein